jgi:hypothetical protein
MEDLVLLEACLHPDWLQSWYTSLRRTYSSSHAHLLRVGTAALAAMHMFVLDKAILYDKEKKLPRQPRVRGGVEVSPFVFTTTCTCAGRWVWPCSWWTASHDLVSCDDMGH